MYKTFLWRRPVERLPFVFVVQGGILPRFQQRDHIDPTLSATQSRVSSQIIMIIIDNVHETEREQQATRCIPDNVHEREANKKSRITMCIERITM